MRAAWFKTVLNPRVGLAILAGVMLALAFPTVERSSLAWLAPGCMLLASLGATGRHAFGLGYLAGLTHYLISLHWLLYIPFPAGAVAGWLALSAYTALYPATWVWLCTRVLLPGPSGPAAAQPDSLGDPGSAGHAPSNRDHQEDSGAGTRSEAPRWAGASPLPAAHPARGPAAGACAARPRGTAALQPLWVLPWPKRALWCLACGAAWVAIEMVLGRFLSGFPWNFLGVSQYQALPLIQIASVTGVYGVSFLVAWSSTALLCTGAAVAARVVRVPRELPAGRPARAPLAGPPWTSTHRSPTLPFRLALASDLALPLVVLLGLTAGGAAQLVKPPPAGRELRIAAVQPSIPQTLIFDPRESTNRFDKIMELSRLALAARPDLLVWPEGSLPSFDESHYRSLTNLIAEHRVWMVFGADDAEPDPEATGPKRRYRFFNSAFLFDRAGQFAATYRKRKLVIFGEYVPLERWFPFVRYLTPVDGGFTPGPGPVWFELSQPPARIAPLICFEDVFASSARAAVDEATDFLLNLTNNGWFGESAAQWQQAASAVFRAVENRLPLVRCTNNGLTCWIDPQGRIRDAGFAGPRDIYGAGFKIFRLPLPPHGAPRQATFYRRSGDVFGWGCVGLTLAAAARTRAPARRHTAPHPAPARESARNQ